VDPGRGSRERRDWRRCLLAALSGTLVLSAVACGSEAAPGRTRASDKACPAGRARLVSLADRPKLLPPRNVTLRQLAGLSRPARLPRTRLADEHRRYRLTAQVVDVQKTAGGLRLTISDGTSRRLVAQIPSTACAAAADPTLRPRFAGARTGAKICSDAVLVGVLFHSPSNRRGLQNGVELAPLLSFSCVAPEVPFGH